MDARQEYREDPRGQDAAAEPVQDAEGPGAFQPGAGGVTKEKQRNNDNCVVQRKTEKKTTKMVPTSWSGYGPVSIPQPFRRACRQGGMTLLPENMPPWPPITMFGPAEQDSESSDAVTR